MKLALKVIKYFFNLVSFPGGIFEGMCIKCTALSGKFMNC